MNVRPSLKNSDAATQSADDSGRPVADEASPAPSPRSADGHLTGEAQARRNREDELPAVGLLMLVDPETGRRREVQTSSTKVRARFAQAAAAQRADSARTVRAAGAAHLDLSTDRAWLLDVVRFVVARRRRR